MLYLDDDARPSDPLGAADFFAKSARCKMARAMKAHECYHCKQWVEKDETTTAGRRPKRRSRRISRKICRTPTSGCAKTAVEFGEQRIYASGSCIMFSRTSCYFFVRPKRNWLELAVFLARAIKSPLVKRVEPKSKVKIAHIIRITHRDEVEAAAHRLAAGSVRVRASCKERREEDSEASRKKKAAKKKAKKKIVSCGT